MVRVIRWSGLTVAGALAVIAPTVMAQDAPSPPETAATADSPTSDSAPAPRKKKGLFGKIKDVAGNKVVKAVAKAALCNMVPGGQLMAGALDATTGDNVGEVVSGGAGAASGSNCMPAMTGTVAGVSTGLVPESSADGAPVAAVAAAGAGMPGMAAMRAMPGGMMTIDDLDDQEGLSTVAGCLGLTVGEYTDLMNPTRGQSRPLTKDEMKRQTTLAKKVDARRYQACIVQQMSASPVQPD